jgi:hypothetical protein
MVGEDGGIRVGGRSNKIEGEGEGGIKEVGRMMRRRERI